MPEGKLAGGRAQDEVELMADLALGPDGRRSEGRGAAHVGHDEVFFP